MASTTRRLTELFIWVTIALGGTVFILHGLLEWKTDDPLRFVSYLVLAIAASGMQIGLPVVTGTMSVSFLFVMLGLVELGHSETMILGCLSTVAPALVRKGIGGGKRQAAFNMASMAIAVAAAYSVLDSPVWASFGSRVLSLMIASMAFYVLSTFTVAASVALKEGWPLQRMFRECFLVVFPYYVIGASLAWAFSLANVKLGWYASVEMFPVIYLIHRSYKEHMRRVDAEKRLVEDVAGLHLRTIEALALAIEAKDTNTAKHLQRVQVYALEIGKELRLSESDLEALKAASILHDIGKLAVPEHIISKPGRLTREEFEKMKIHPIVGAEILERVQFPYPVVPIVRAHHEKWNGSGYPYGLKGEEIPLAARILSVADCVDALSSDRQYRRGIPIEDAVRHVVSEAGISFDPAVVDVLVARFRDLERMNQEVTAQRGNKALSIEIPVNDAEAPGAGLEQVKAEEASEMTDDFLALIAAARQEVQMLFELSHEIGNSLSLDETLGVLSMRMKRLVPYDTMVIYIVREGTLRAEYVTGENSRLFSSLAIPVGEGLSGWVAHNRKPIVNGNPAVEPGYMADPSRMTVLRSGLAVPLEGLQGVVGVLALYRAAKDAFTRDHLRILLGIATKLSMSVENALKFRQVEQSAGTDFLTQLPNARSLFLHLDKEVTRAERQGSSLYILVCDLDGFKLVNDRFGHLEGNRILRGVADKLREHCREYDYVARMGGDEFMIVMPGITKEGAIEAGDRFNRSVIEVAKQILPNATLSLSVGVAEYPTHGANAEQLIAEADRLMYQQKQQRKLARQNNTAFTFDRANQPR